LRYYNANFQWVAYFDSKCEFCGNPFSFSQNYTSVGGGTPLSSGSFTSNSARQEALDNMGYNKNMLRSGDFGFVEVHKCPSCGYIQSWMIKKAKEDDNPFFVAILLCLVLLPASSFFNSTYYGLGGILELMRLGFSFDFQLAADPGGSLQRIAVLLINILTAIGLPISFYKYRRFNREFNPNAKVLRGQAPPAARESPRVSFSNEL
jgi:hypothetical protein